MAQIGGPHVQVTSILSSPGTDPRLYESDIASALAVARARLVIANGAGYDDFMSQLLAATVNAGRVALSVQAVLGAYRPDVNPLFWYDIPGCRGWRLPSRPRWPGGSAGRTIGRSG